MVSTNDLRARAEWLEGHLAEHDDLHGHEAQSATPGMLRDAANEIDRLRGLINPTSLADPTTVIVTDGSPEAEADVMRARVRMRP